MLSDLKIGELAEACGVSRDTVRYYERLKLLPRAARTQGGYRIYREADVERVRFIKQAQAVGLSLDEIRALVFEGKGGLEQCQRVRDLLAAKLKELDALFAEMRAFRHTLMSYLGECDQALLRKDRDTCPVLFELSHSSAVTRSATNRRRKKREKP
ncbi:MAG TPA: heavy metal-responsive transcriptional regulator [Blastocatellia bacterium]|nr:heavy metal-responsive transcriptional regulator [Blastocatellia bacterium]